MSPCLSVVNSFLLQSVSLYEYTTLCLSIPALFLEKTLFSLLNYLSTFGNNQLTTYVQIYFRTLLLVGSLYLYFSPTVLTVGKTPDTELNIEREIHLIEVVCVITVTFPR